METANQVDCARAVLTRLRNQLLVHQQRHPNPQTLVPADNATLINETLANLEGLYGAPWVESLSISRWAIVPASRRSGGSPVMDSVSRAVLLSHLRRVLHRLETDTPLANDFHVATLPGSTLAAKTPPGSHLPGTAVSPRATKAAPVVAEPTIS